MGLSLHLLFIAFYLVMNSRYELLFRNKLLTLVFQRLLLLTPNWKNHFVDFLLRLS